MDVNEKPAGKFDITRRAGSKEATLCQQHWVGWDKSLKRMYSTIVTL